MSTSNALQFPVYPKQDLLPALEKKLNYINDTLIPAKLFLPCVIRILVVTDSSGTFDETADFGLGHFLKAFTRSAVNNPMDNPAAYVRFDVKTAHRGNVAADFKNFKFDAQDLSVYDQIWLFGVSRGGSPLSNKELKAIAQFMNNGGGVFATGDHEDLGVELCGRLPRVRCMRRWWFSSADPLGSPAAPPVSGANHNTIVDNPATALNEEGAFQFQSDNYPQTIFPRYKRVYTGRWPMWRRFPHPILCSQYGIIKVMPDHMHEGRCDIYADFGRTLTFDGYSFAEFPNQSGTSTQLKPTVVADSLNQLTDHRFESISVYDGHLTDDNGRIVCDATWHHFFNINLVGFEDSRQRIRAGGTLAEDIRSEQAYVRIRAYYRNIAYWLARRRNQNCLRTKGIHLVLHEFDFKIAVKPWKLVKYKAEYLLMLGEMAKDALNHYAPKCQWYEWILVLFKDYPLFKKFHPFEIDGPVFDEPILFDPEKIHSIALGLAVHNLFHFAEEQKSFTDKTYARFDKIATEGLEEILDEAISQSIKEAKSYAVKAGK